MLKTTTFMLKIYKAMSHYNYLIKKINTITTIALIGLLFVGCAGVVKVGNKNIYKHFKEEKFNCSVEELVITKHSVLNEYTNIVPLGSTIRRLGRHVLLTIC